MEGHAGGPKFRIAVLGKTPLRQRTTCFCHDMEVNVNKSLELVRFVPSAVGELLRVKHRCDKKCNEMWFKLHVLAAIVTEKGEHDADDQSLQELL